MTDAERAERLLLGEQECECGEWYEDTGDGKCIKCVWEDCKIAMVADAYRAAGIHVIHPSPNEKRKMDEAEEAWNEIMKEYSKKMEQSFDPRLFK